MNRKYEIDTLVNVARMYYLDGLKQDEIAKKVNVSRSLISLILTEAKELGIVDIKINDPRNNNEELAIEFMSRFRLERAYVVPTSLKEQDFRLSLAVRRGIEVFNNIVKKGDTIGISWGKTIYTFMREYTSDAVIEDLNIMPLVGSTDRSLKRYHMNEVVRQFAEKVYGTGRFIHAPIFPVSKEDRDLYVNSSALKEIAALWDNVDIAMFSIAAPPRQYSDIISESIERGDKFTEKLAASAVGDICARFFDEVGNFIQDEIADLTIAIPMETLAKAKKKLCIVSGDHKISSIISGLKTTLVDILIIDETTARSVIRRIDTES